MEIKVKNLNKKITFWHLVFESDWECKLLHHMLSEDNENSSTLLLWIRYKAYFAQITEVDFFSSYHHSDTDLGANCSSPLQAWLNVAINVWKQNWKLNIIAVLLSFKPTIVFSEPSQYQERKRWLHGFLQDTEDVRRRGVISFLSFQLY